MGTKIMLSGVRCSFLTLGEPEQYQGKGAYRWSATALVPYDSPLKKRIDDALLQVAKEHPKWGKKYQSIYDNVMADPKGTCWIDGKRKDYDGYQNCFALTAHRYKDKGRPLVMDKDKSPIYMANNEIYDGKGGILYSGCFVNMQVELWAQDNDNGKGLRATLLGIQKAGDADAFGGGVAPDADDFGEVTEGADAEDLT
jgi:hypothetical protein